MFANGAKAVRAIGVGIGFAALLAGSVGVAYAGDYTYNSASPTATKVDGVDMSKTLETSSKRPISRSAWC